jgi:hypothetical protein
MKPCCVGINNCGHIAGKHRRDLLHDYRLFERGHMLQCYTQASGRFDSENQFLFAIVVSLLLKNCRRDWQYLFTYIRIMKIRCFLLCSGPLAIRRHQRGSQTASRLSMQSCRKLLITRFLASKLALGQLHRSNADIFAPDCD